MAIEVNGELISNADIRAEMAALRTEREKSGESISLEERMGLREEAIENLIERTLLMQEARRLGLTPSPDEIERAAASLAPRADGISGCRAGADAAALRTEAERRLMIDALVMRWAVNVALPPAGEIRKCYRDHREELAVPEMVHASHIVKNFDGEDRSAQRERVAALRERLLAGEDFATLARTESDCPENGGDLGWFVRGIMVEEFEDVVFTAEPGRLTDVFETRFGAHVAIVHKRRPAGVPSFDEIADNIRDNLHRARIDREVERRLESLYQRAAIREIA